MNVWWIAGLSVLGGLIVLVIRVTWIAYQVVKDDEWWFRLPKPRFDDEKGDK